MPDGDRLHLGLSLRYQMPYRRLCEGVLRPDEQARGLAERIKRDIIDAQCDLAPALRSVTAYLSNLAQQMRGQGNNALDWQSEILSIRQAILDAAGARSGSSSAIAVRGISKRNCEIVLRAAQDVLNDMEEGRAPDNTARTLCRRFIRHLYQSQFGAAAPLLEEHFNNVESTSLRQRLQEIKPHLDLDLDHLADQLADQADRDALRLRLRARKREKIQDLDSDIMDVFN